LRGCIGNGPRRPHRSRAAGKRLAEAEEVALREYCWSEMEGAIAKSIGSACIDSRIGGICFASPPYALRAERLSRIQKDYHFAAAATSLMIYHLPAPDHSAVNLRPDFIDKFRLDEAFSYLIL